MFWITCEIRQRKNSEAGGMTQEAPLDFSRKYDEHVSMRILIRKLISVRLGKGLTQKDVAEKMNCSQGRVCKLEGSRDVDIKIGDLKRYAGVLGIRTLIILENS